MGGGGLKTQVFRYHGNQKLLFLLISPLILSFLLFENEHTDLKKQAIRDPYLNEDDFTDARETIVCKLIIFYNV